MTVFRWILGIVTLLMAGGALVSFTLFIALDVNVWLERARRFRHWTWLAMLLWFNVEVWGRVLYTIIHW